MTTLPEDEQAAWILIDRKILGKINQLKTQIMRSKLDVCDVSGAKTVKDIFTFCSFYFGRRAVRQTHPLLESAPLIERESAKSAA